MSPATRQAHTVDRLRHVYIHRAGRRRMPHIMLSRSQGRDVAESLANLNGMPDEDEIFAEGGAVIFGILVTWAALH